MIWFGSIPPTSPPPVPRKSWIGNAWVHSKSSNVSDYKRTSSPCLPRCATSMTSFTFHSSTPSKQPVSSLVFLRHLLPSTLKTTKNTLKLKIFSTQNAKVVASTISSNGKVTQILRIPGSRFLVSRHAD